MLGLFDSGIGGLTVVKELLKRSPNASFVYLGDTARAPYGNKSADTIRRYAVEDAHFLVERGATAIAIACNTASSLALDALREAFPAIHFFDVVSPAVEASSKTKAGKIGVIGTRATINSGVYERQLKTRDPGLTVLSAACPLFVPLVEEGWANKPETKRIARTYLATLKQKQVQTLILGCTHYPLLEPTIRATMQKRVRIINSAAALLDAIAADRPDLLAAQDDPRQEFFFSDVSPHTDAIASRWLGRAVKGERTELA